MDDFSSSTSHHPHRSEPKPRHPSPHTDSYCRRRHISFIHLSPPSNLFSHLRNSHPPPPFTTSRRQLSYANRQHLLIPSPLTNFTTNASPLPPPYLQHPAPLPPPPPLPPLLPHILRPNHQRHRLNPYHPPPEHHARHRPIRKNGHVCACGVGLSGGGGVCVRRGWEERSGVWGLDGVFRGWGGGDGDRGGAVKGGGESHS